MSSAIDEIKLGLVQNKSQVVIFHTDGQVQKSCNTLFNVNSASSIYNQFDFLKSLEELIPTLPLAERLHFGAVEWEEQVNGLFSISLERVQPETVHWVIQDKTEGKSETQKIQQERNEATINEEFLDIQRKYLEMEKELLHYKNQELERIQAFKTQFFAEVSHEMRTPLNSIGGLINLLQEGPKSRSSEYLKALSATSTHLNSIINDILDLSKVEAGKLELNNSPFDLRKSLQNVVTGFSHMVQEKGLELILTIDQEVPKTLDGDAVRLTQVVYNLLGNALKFTGNGHVELRVVRLKKSSERCELGFEVSDTGKGMSPESIQRILEPYGQAEGQDYGQYGGTGLGMGIAKELINLMGGQLSIKSEVGVGTKMAFSINFGITGESIPSSDEITLRLGHLNVLIAEDDPVSQMVLKDSLAKFQILAPQLVSSVKELKTALETSKFDVVLSDLNLTDGNSLALFSEMAAQSLPPIIFLSGDISEQPKSFEFDNWHFLLKPVNLNALGTLLKGIKPTSMVDLSNLKVATHQNVDLMKELIQIILDTLPEEIEKINVALSESELVIAKKGLHKIGPSVSYLGNDQLIDTRRLLHDRLENSDDITVEFDQFSVEILTALGELKAIEI
ncbi:hybrid sensor histidine kinase/response regulator [Roseivirga misakiensis]|uniref:histidine kinase n=1 Tax=Roseivirga misakiensis TaxID=1563681 RepID=A0A1E5T6F0_9BACT|nr:ATP-binding protein [Roseivirga misakiensis]OEK06955.1 hypothetical protein BFP71_04675 [Roseivirga misakiensis]